MTDLERMKEITDVLNEMYEYYDDSMETNVLPTNKPLLCPYSVMGFEEDYDCNTL